MHFSAERGGPRTAAVVIGLITFLISLGLTAALLALDLISEERRSNRQLDLAGQGVVESLHQDIRSRELVLIGLAGERDLRGVDHSQRLSPMLAWPEVVAVGHAETELARVEWLGGTAPDLPAMVSGSVEEALIDMTPTSRTVHIVNGNTLVLAYPTGVGDNRSWDLAAIDLVAAAYVAVPEALESKLTWSVTSVPRGEALRASDRTVHREYLILDPISRWLFEFRWTPEELAELGVGVDGVYIGVGLALSAVLALLATRLVHRRYMQVELEASRNLVEQKDLLLLALSHQLRTPLTAVIGFLGLALDREHGMPDAQRDELLDLAKTQAEDAAEIVEDLVVAARVQDENLVLLPKPTDILPIVEAVFVAGQETGEVLEVAEGEERAVVYADAMRIRQLIRNVFDEGRNAGARRWKVVATPTDTAVDIVFMADFKLPERGPMLKLSADQVALPKSMAAIHPHLTTATRLAEAMGGGITSVTAGGATAIHLLLPRTHFEESELVEPLSSFRRR